MKILLVQTTFLLAPVQGLDDSYPMGLGYLHASLEIAGYNVTTLPLVNASMEETFQVLGEELKSEPDLIGFQMLTGNRISTMRFVDFCFDTLPKVKVVLGGIHATAYARQIVERDHRVMVLRGEAEDSLVTLADCLSTTTSQSKLKFCPGLVFFNGIEVTEGPVATLPEISKIPILKHKPFLNSSAWTASTLTTRGCPFTCSFCAVARRQMRYRPIEDVVDEVEQIAEAHPNIRVVRFFDDQMFFNLSRSIELCQALMKRRTGLHFTSMARLKPTSEELASALEAAGFIEVSFGLETGSPKVAKRMGKGINVDDAYECITHFSKVSIRTFLFLIAGLSGEDIHTAEETGHLVRDLQKIKYMFQSETTGIATVYPQTKLFEQMIESETISNDYWFNYEDVPFFTAEHSIQELLQYHNLITDYTDPTALFKSKRAIIFQESLLRSLAYYVAINWYEPEGPRCNRNVLKPYIGWLIRAASILQKNGYTKMYKYNSENNAIFRKQDKIEDILKIFSSVDENQNETSLITASLKEVLTNGLSKFDGLASARGARFGRSNFEVEV